MGKFGYQGTDYSKEQYLAWKGQGRKRTSGHETEYLKENDIINKMNDPHLNVGYEREHYGGLKIKAAGSADSGKNMQFSEEWSHAEGKQVLPDGSVGKWVGGTVNEYSGSKISTNIGPSDSCSCNHSVTRSGNNDNDDYAASGAPKGGGSSYHEAGHNNQSFTGGQKMDVGGRSKYGGMVIGSHGQVCDSGGKGDQGYGWTVCDGDEWQIFHGGFGDGTYVCAVGKVASASQPKGTYTLTVDKGGNLTIKTEGAVRVESGGTQTFKAPHIVLDSEVFVTKHLEASEYLKAPFCHSCADKAKGSC